MGKEGSGSRPFPVVPILRPAGKLAAMNGAAEPEPDFPEFTFAGNGVGVLSGNEPREPGLWSYMPFRSHGHYLFAAVLNAGGQPECHVTIDGQRLIFTVSGEAEYGVLTVTAVKHA
jgi:hypothetical protein